MEPVCISSSHEDLDENLHDTSTASLFTESTHRVVGRSRRAVCLRPPEKPRATRQSHHGPHISVSRVQSNTGKINKQTGRCSLPGRGNGRGTTRWMTGGARVTGGTEMSLGGLVVVHGGSSKCWGG